ncbi:MAG: exodeoxyribonuclease VII large subunit [Myxococcota bacterium]
MSTLSLFDRPGLDGGEGPAADERGRVWRVAEVNRAIKVELESGWGDVWIEGELGEVTRAASGHVYFTLCDEKETAQLRGVMFRSDARRVRARLESGARVRVRGSLSLYEARGAFQLIARIALPTGDGDLALRFERIRRKLEAEGLMDPARKRPLPRLPRVVGVVTSAHGAALHDIVRVARHRCPVRIVVADCRVQGEGAPPTIVAALDAIQRLPELDVVIVARGGGSAEELWSFNDERVARAVAACAVPVVSGVGHEVDVSICDLVADARAATPSNAAELVVPDRDALARDLEGCTRRLERAMDGRLHRERLALERQARRVTDPRHALGGVRRRLDGLTQALAGLTRRRLSGGRAQVAQLTRRLVRHDPRTRLGRDRQALEGNAARLATAVRRALGRRREELGSLAARLDAMSPVKVLARGYAIALSERTGRAVTSAAEVEVDERLHLRLASGAVRARVEERDTSEE